jgi:hypothetical protein
LGTWHAVPIKTNTAPKVSQQHRFRKPSTFTKVVEAVLGRA